MTMIKHIPVVLAVMVTLTGTAVLLRGVQGHPSAAAHAQPVAAPSATDVEFITRAAQRGDAETALAALAGKKSRRAQVTALADRVQRDHEAANTALHALAKQRDVAIPAITIAQASTYDRLGDLTGEAFEKAWLDQSVKNHQDAIALFSKATKSSDADVKAFAEHKLPVLREHLKSAQDLQRGGASRQ